MQMSWVQDDPGWHGSPRGQHGCPASPHAMQTVSESHTLRDPTHIAVPSKIQQGSSREPHAPHTLSVLQDTDALGQGSSPEQQS